MADYEIFKLGDVELQSGVSFRSARLAYKTFGALNGRKDNVVVFPTFYGGTHVENEPLIGDGRALDLLLVTDLTPKEIIYGKIGGVLVG